MNLKGLAFIVSLAVMPAMVGRGADNIALAGTAIMGANDGTDITTYGRDYQHSNTGGRYSYLNDGFTIAATGTYTSTDDTYGAYQTDSFGGIKWTPTQLAPFTGDEITSLNLYFYIFGDGGWFGQRNTGLSGGKITAAELGTPVVQISLDGTLWTTVAATSHYTDTVANGGLAGQTGGNTGPITFTLDTPISLVGLKGIRVIGPGGGTASGGFVGFNEIQVIAGAVPEPSTWVMLLLGSAAVLLLVRRKARA